MVALCCGIALIPSVVMDNSPEPVRSRITLLEHGTPVAPLALALGVCAQRKQLQEPLIDAFWQLLER